MRVVIFFLSIFFTILINPSFSQTSKKQMMDRYKQIVALPIEEIKNGKHSALAEAFTLDKFINFYIEYGKDHWDKKFGKTEIIEVYKDSLFFYFIKQGNYIEGKYVVNFFKVSSKDLYNINYLLLEKDSLQKQFIREVIPQSDKDKVALRKKTSIYNYTPESYTMKFEFLKESNRIKTTCKWEVDNLHTFKIFKKTYTSYYNLHAGFFEK